MKVTDEMVSRFLNWPLPQTFGPDGGVKFERTVQTAEGERNRADLGPSWWPVGTNLFTAVEARAMLEHVLAEPTATQAPEEVVQRLMGLVDRYASASASNGWDQEDERPHRAAIESAIRTALATQAAEIAQMQAENFALAAGQCANVTGDEGGTPRCKEIAWPTAEVEVLREKRRQSSRSKWDTMRVPCKGPCWNGVWLVFEKRGHDTGPYLLNAAGNPKRFRSEGAARRVADKLNRGEQ